MATKATQPAVTKATQPAVTKATVATKAPVQTPQLPVETSVVIEVTSAPDFPEPPVDFDQETGNDISVKRVIIVAVVIVVLGRIIFSRKKK
jgi:hypothetical protein